MPDTVQPTSSAAGSGGELCTSCGLCCMGSLHDFVHLDADELRLAEDLGLPVLPGETPSFSLPCPRLVDRRCGIFPTRPRVCGAYRCQLLIDKEAGKVDLASALDIVAEAQRLLRNLQATMSSGTVPKARQRASDGLKASPESLLGPAHEQHMRERLHAMALDIFLDRHFRSERDGRMYVAKG